MVYKLCTGTHNLHPTKYNYKYTVLAQAVPVFPSVLRREPRRENAEIQKSKNIKNICAENKKWKC